MELFLKAIASGLLSGTVTVGRIALIVIPLITLMELARHFGLFEVLQGRIGVVARLLKLPPQAAFPLLVGIFFGLVYGAALIIEYIREGYLTSRDVTVLTIFMGLNHSMIEDTALFTAVGANPAVLVLVRLLIAVICTRLAARLLDSRALSKQQGLEKNR
ncbi:MAG TPA: nucleoside recognition protein [Firmicutes bacterium]|nr:nucleoside recognition protein [Bacillota bacterium]